MSASIARRFRPLLLLVGLLFLLPGCVIYDRDAEVRAYWTFAGQDCAAAGVSFVQVILEERFGSDDRDSRLLRCSDGWVEFDGLDPGDYRIIALGFPRTGDYASWDLDRIVDLRPGFNEFTLDLVPVGSW